MSESKRNDQKWTAQAASKLLSALNRADELGGELRDYLQDKLAHDPRVASARTRIARLLGRTSPPHRPAADRAPGTAAGSTAAGSTAAGSTAAGSTAAGSTAAGSTAAGPPPAASAGAPAPVEARPRGFGDPSIKAQIYGKRSCPWTGRAISLLERRKVDFDFVDLEEPEHEAKLASLTQETRQNTVPYVYLRGRFVGGFNALSEIERLGQLEVALMSKEELTRAPAHVRAVEIVPRPNTDEVAPAEVGPPPDAAG
jgi:glutaredoxin